MDLRSRKSGLKVQQQLQDTSFRLRKPKKCYVRQSKRQSTDDTIFSLTSLVQNISNPPICNNNNIPLRLDNLEVINVHDVSNYSPNKDVNQEYQDNEEYENQLTDEYEMYQDEYENQLTDEYEMDVEYDDIASSSSQNKSVDDNEENLNASNVKQYDHNNKTFFFPGKAGPYFPNYTHFLLFIWVTKHQIGMYTLFFIFIFTTIRIIF